MPSRTGKAAPSPSNPSSATGTNSPSEAGRLATVIQAKRRNLGVETEPASTLKTSILRLSPTSCSDEESEQREARWDRENQLREAQARRERVAALWAAANVPLRHQRPFDAAPDSPWFNALCEVEGMPCGSLILLCGQRGTGKTQIAAKVIARACRNLESSLYTTAIEIFLHLREAMKGEGADSSERRLLGEYAGYSLLIIDEAHERGETDWEDRMLTHLIDRRYREMRTTILITNHQRGEALTSLGPSFTDRLRECGGVIECNWQSFRRTDGSAGGHAAKQEASS